MIKRFLTAFQQLNYLFYEVSLIVNRKYWRWLTCWIGGGAGIIASYRLDRFFYLLLGDSWVLFRVVLFPIFLLLRVLSSSHEIHYRAQIGKGLKILHGSLGIVVSGHAIIGENLMLTGGNCIGQRKAGHLKLGNNITLGANAVILGPVLIGDRVRVGAGAVVVHDAQEGTVLVGVPAYPINDEQRNENYFVGSQFP